MFTNISCAQEKKEPAPAAPSAKKAAASDLVYLKIEKALASSFDETPDWAPKPDAMTVADASLETRWSSGYNDKEWICVDFGKAKTVTKIVIKWEQAYATSFEISTSNDAKDWKKLIQLDNQTGGTNEIAVPPTTCRYVKLLGLARVNADWGISIWELELYGPKDKNPGDFPLEETFKPAKEQLEAQKKLEDVKLKLNGIVPSPGAITTKEFQKGVNYTSWDINELLSDKSDYSLIYLSDIGVGHVGVMAVHYQADISSPVIYPDEKKTVSDESLAHAINVIHALGMKVMLKPHVDLADDEARSNIIPSEGWFVSYKKFILHYAQIAQKYNVELLCIGTELSNTTIVTWKEKWLDIISEIRKVYKGPLVYAANWDEYETVSFWPEMDYIGMDAYFPLTKDNNPPLKDLEAAWENHADVIQKWLEDNKLDKPVIFTEVGYDSVEGSNKQPWAIRPTLASLSESQEEQANCLLSVFEVLTKRSWFKGFYWWNYFPRPDIGSLDYTLRGKKGDKILTDWFNRLK